MKSGRGCRAPWRQRTAGQPDWNRRALWLHYSRLSWAAPQTWTPTPSEQEKLNSFLPSSRRLLCSWWAQNKYWLNWMFASGVFPSFYSAPPPHPAQPGPPAASSDPWKLHIDEILRQVKENTDVKNFLCPLASSLPSTVPYHPHWQKYRLNHKQQHSPSITRWLLVGDNLPA